MIITKTPFRMSFFGGGTDIENFYQKYGGAILSTTFDKYAYVDVRHLPRFHDYSTQLAYSKMEYVQSVDEIQHPAIREAMRYLDIHEIRLSYDADLPARSGLGTSSSFAVGMLNAFYALKGKYVGKKKLADDAIYLERALCKEVGGIQDQIAASFGGFNRIDIACDGSYTITPVIMSVERRRELNHRLMLFFTGFSRLSSDIQANTQKSMNQKTVQLLEMKGLVETAENILESKTNLDEFGELLDYTWKLKRGIANGISTNFIDSIYDRAKKAGALGGKLLGAGGGGFLLFYAREDTQETIRECLKDLLYVPFEFETDGTRIIYYTPEQWGET